MITDESRAAVELSGKVHDILRARGPTRRSKLLGAGPIWPATTYGGPTTGHHRHGEELIIPDDDDGQPHCLPSLPVRRWSMGTFGG